MNDTELDTILTDPAARTLYYKEMVEGYYNRVTDTYRRAWGDSFHLAIFTGSETLQEAVLATERWVADAGGFRPGMRVLDVGCGIGGPALNIAEYSGAHVTGINIVPRQLKLARLRAAERGLSARTHFELADAMQMPFLTGAFDAVYMFDAGCHMPDKAQFYQECARVLRPGGVFLGNEWLRKEGLAPAEEAQYIEPVCRYFAVPHLVTLGELGLYLTAAGFDIEVLEDTTVHGNILRNWELMDDKNLAGVRAVLPSLMFKTIKGLRSLAPGLLPPVLRLLTDGGIALSEAARAGAFLIGHWRARKPTAAEGQ